MSPPLRHGSPAIASAALVLATLPASAVDRTWNGTDGNWTTDANWTGGVEPTAGDDAFINAGDVTVNSTGEVADLLTVADTTGPLTQLLVNNGGVLTVNGTRLANVPGSTGRVEVNANSSWIHNFTLSVGRFGNGTLDVLNGGTVSSTNATLGGGLGADGFVTIDGFGSNWTTTASSGLIVGQQGDGTFTISNGGLADSNQVQIGNLATGVGTLTVTDALSALNIAGDIEVGDEGMGTLTVQAAGVVSNDAGYIGRSPGSTGTATVTGANSNWNNTFGLYVGGDTSSAGGTGTLDIEAGGTVDVTGGPLKVWGGGTVNLDGGTLNVQTLDVQPGGAFNFNTGTLGLNSGDLDVEAGGLFGATLTVDANQVYDVANRVRVGNGGNLTVQNGGQLENTDGWIGLIIPSVATVTGVGSTWTNTGIVSVGELGNGTLNIEAGGAVTSTTGILANTSSSTGAATVTGANSTWTSTGQLIIGEEGTGTLTIQNGGVVQSGSLTSGIIGGQDTGTGTVTVTGSGSAWINSDLLNVGDFGDATLLIQDGGMVENTGGRIALRSSSEAVVTVGGNGSTWTNTAGLYVGGSTSSAGGTGTLNIETGGTVDVTGGPLKLWADGTVNLNGGTLNLGGGPSNVQTLDVQPGGAFNFNSGTLGLTSGDLNVEIDGLFGDTLTIDANQAYDVASDVVVGLAGTLTVQNGGQLENTDGLIGLEPGDVGVATVTGANSTWTNTGQLVVGNGGDGTLNVEAGGAVSNTTGIIGSLRFSTSEATVTGANSTWTNTAGLYVGGDMFSSGGTGTLNIETGGTVDVTGGPLTLWNGGTVNLDGGTLNLQTLDVQPGGAFNFNTGTLGLTSGDLNVEGGGLFGGTLTVDANQVYDVANNVRVGLAGTLTVQNGGQLENADGLIGFGSPSVATVTGVGSTWTNTGSLIVGDFGDGTLNVEAGGAVTNTTGTLGVVNGFTGEATVTGPGSTWTNTAGLYVGGNMFSSGGTGTLNIEAGGTVNVTGGPLTLWNGGTVNLDGGMLNVQTLDVQPGGAFNFNTGTLGLTSDDLLVGAGGLLGSTLDLTTGKTVSVTNATEIASGGQLQINGGTFHTGSIDPLSQGPIIFNTGTFGLTSDDLVVDTGGLFGNSLIANAGQTYNVTNSTVIQPGGTFTLDGGTLNTGVLDVQPGGVFTFNSGTLGLTSEDLLVGAGGLFGATLTVDANQVYDVANDVLVGIAGTLTVQNGGQLENTEGFIGFGLPNVATVTGAGSTWTNTGDLIVGYFGNGTLNVEAGGAVTNTTGIISNLIGFTGEATVTGPGSTWTNTAGLFVGGDPSSSGGTGTLNIEAGGTVDVTGGPLKLWAGGTVNLDGGTLDADSIEHTDGGTFSFLDGTLSVDSFDGTLTQNGGTLSPGDSPGLTQITGEYLLNAGTLAIEIGGTTPGTQFDRVEVGGFALLVGELDVTLIDGFTPAPGDSFGFLLANNGFTAAFSAVNLPDLSDQGLDWQLNLEGAAPFLEVTGTLLREGDYNSDGFVSQADLDLVLLNWGQAVVPAGFDASAVPGGGPFDGLISQNELDGVLLNWGSGFPPSVTAIPEPGGFAALVGLGSLVLRRRR